MTAGAGELSGNGPQQVYINVFRTGQDAALNRTYFHITVRYLAKGFGSWSGATQSWSANAQGAQWSGSFVIGSPGNADITLLDVDFYLSHDGEGHLGAFTSTATINTNHSSIGSGSVQVPEEAAPRIAKRPASPGAPVVSNLKPTSVRLDWPGSPDHRGASVDQYLLRISKSDPADSGAYSDYAVNPATLGFDVPNLTPGTNYYAVVYARNAATYDSGGYSNKSAQTTFRTPSGFYVWNGAEWRPTEVSVWNGSEWRPAEVSVFDGAAWKAAG